MRPVDARNRVAVPLHDEDVEGEGPAARIPSATDFGAGVVARGRLEGLGADHERAFGSPRTGALARLQELMADVERATLDNLRAHRRLRVAIGGFFDRLEGS